MDLAQSFGPSWARGEDSPDRLEQLAKKHKGGEEPRQRRGGSDDFGGGGPRKPRPSGDRDRGDRGKRPNSGRRDDARSGKRGPAPIQKIEPALKGWTLRFLPDRRGVEGLAKQIKQSAKAFPLFDLARLVLEKSERYVVEFKRTDDAQPIWQVKADGTLWTSESEAGARALTANIEKFYRRERVTVDPPKGSFPFVAVCGMSGNLLGPPNYHDYQSKIVQLYQERFSNLPFDVFKGRIKMERDEELIEKWREEQSTRDVYYPIDPAEAEAKAEDPVDAAPPAENAENAEVPAETTPDSVANVAEIPAPEVEPETPTAEVEPPAPAPESAAPESAEPEAPAAEAEVTPEPEAEPETPATEPTGERFETMADVEQHFRANHGTGLIVAIRDRVAVAGSAALNDSAPPVLELARNQWDELNRFPLPVAHGLGQQLASKGLHVFKPADKITYISIARPKWLDLATNPVSDALSGMLTYLAEHEKTPRPEQWAGLVDLRPTELADRDSAVARDLSWLIHEGYIVDFARKGLWVVPRPKNRQPESKPKSAPVTPAAAAVPAALDQPPIAASSPEPQPAATPALTVEAPAPAPEPTVVEAPPPATETAVEPGTAARPADTTAPE